MYRCSECNKEFKEKVDFCDCGNDEFIFIEDLKQIKSPIKKEPMTLEQKSQIVSLVFFIVCLLLSFVVWLIPINKNQEEIKITEDKNEVKENLEIPNIDKFWDNTLPKPEVVVRQEAKPEPLPVQNVVKVVQPPVKKSQQVKVQQKSQVVQNKPKTNVTKPVTQPKSAQTVQNKQNKKNNVKQSNANQSTDKTDKNKVIQPKTQEVKQKTQDVKPKAQEVKEQPKKVYNPNSPEMLKYKGELRAALFRKFPVGSIQGSGSCSVHFSIDLTGKLINRGFTKQSDNKSLNDAVYYMLMSVPRFKAPPASYSGETINMTFTLNNGSYAVTIN